MHVGFLLCANGSITSAFKRPRFWVANPRKNSRLESVDINRKTCRSSSSFCAMLHSSKTSRNSLSNVVGEVDTNDLHLSLRV